MTPSSVIFFSFLSLVKVVHESPHVQFWRVRPITYCTCAKTHCANIDTMQPTMSQHMGGLIEQQHNKALCSLCAQ